MNCHACGKKLVAGYALCGACGSHLGNGIEQTRLGYFVQHPEKMVDELLHDAPWCRNLAECITAANRDEALDEEKCKQCCREWLMEKVEGAWSPPARFVRASTNTEDVKARGIVGRGILQNVRIR